MQFIFIFKIATILSAIISSLLALYVIGKVRTSRPLHYYAGLMLANALYAASYLLEIHMPELSGAVNCLKIEYMGLSFIPVFWVLIAWSYNSGEAEKERISFEPLHLLLIIPVSIIILVWTNPLHHLVYKSISLVEGLPLTVLKVERAPFFWIANSIFIILYITGTTRIIYYITNSRGRFQGQCVLLLGAAVLPVAAHTLLLMQQIPYNLDIVPITFAFSGILLFWGMVRIQLFDLLPIARGMVINAMEDAVFVLDTKDRIVEGNRSAVSLFLHNNKSSQGHTFETLNPVLWKKLKRINDSAEVAADVNGKDRYYKVTRSEINHKLYGTMGSLFILHDITEMKARVENLRRLASYDGLTGLFNRRHFMKLAAMEVSRVNRYKGHFTLIMFDLDHFKLVNDEYGHLAGDEVLKMISRLIQENTRSEDLYARYGGEEFILLYKDTTAEQTDISIERLREAIETSSVSFEGNEIRITASFGISSFTSDSGMSLEACLQQADDALYEAKKSGRNQIRHFEPAKDKVHG